MKSHLKINHLPLLILPLQKNLFIEITNFFGYFIRSGFKNRSYKESIFNDANHDFNCFKMKKTS